MDNAVRVLFLELLHHQTAHAGPASASQRVDQLERLQSITLLDLPPDSVKTHIDHVGSIRVETLGPIVVASTTVVDEKTVRTVEHAVRSGSYLIDGA